MSSKEGLGSSVDEERREPGRRKSGKGKKLSTRARGRPRVDHPAEQSSARDRSPRSACDFCHNKRVKCVMAEGRTRCNQCTQRDTDCVFSLKGKTGPKPKSAKPERMVPLRRGKNKSRRHCATSPKEPSSSSLPPRDVTLSPPRPQPGAVPVAANTTAAGQEWVFLNAYISTIGTLLPLVHEETLRRALRERQRLPSVLAAARGAGQMALEQAEVVGAIAIGALIRGDVASGKEYSLALVFHLDDDFQAVEPRAAPALGLMALYCQHQGDDTLKLQWLDHARRALGNGHIPGDLVLCIEYLDYAREAWARPGVDSLPSTRRALHTVSCLLSNMSSIINPAVGKPIALAFCNDLDGCIRSLKTEVRVQLPLLLCKSLRALLLVMLGRGASAMAVLEALPDLVEEADGGNPTIVRALPLSWDALLIAGSLSFLLGQTAVYRRLRAAVVAANYVQPAAQWTFCLPDPESDVHTYVSHECNSSSNICTIMCEIATTTGFGHRPFYPTDHRDNNNNDQQPQFPPSALPTHQHLDDAAPEARSTLPRPQPMYSPPPNIEIHSGPVGRSFGYGAGGMAKRVLQPSSSGGEGSFATGGGGKAAQADEGRGGDPSSDTSKRRRIMPGSRLEETYERQGAVGTTHSNVSDNSNAVCASSPALAENGAISRGASGAGGVASLSSINDKGTEEDDDNLIGLGLTKGLHDMSLTRLCGESVGHLGRFPSEGIIDLGSTIGSFGIGSVGFGDHADHDDLKDDTLVGILSGGVSGGAERRSPHYSRLTSFMAHSTDLLSTLSSGRFSSMSQIGTGDVLARVGGGGAVGVVGAGSFEVGSVTGSDLGHDIVVFGDGFLEGHDFCGGTDKYKCKSNINSKNHNDSDTTTNTHTNTNINTNTNTNSNNNTNTNTNSNDSNDSSTNVLCVDYMCTSGEPGLVAINSTGGDAAAERIDKGGGSGTEDDGEGVYAGVARAAM